MSRVRSPESANSLVLSRGTVTSTLGSTMSSQRFVLENHVFKFKIIIILKTLSVGLHS